MPTAVIADDSRLMRKMLRDLLQTVGVTVIAEAQDGDEAIRMCDEHRPDLLILDIAMPGRDGISAKNSIEHLSPSTIVILLSYNTAESTILAQIQAALEQRPVTKVPSPLN